MTADPLDDLFHAALAIPVDQRESWLHEACGDNAELGRALRRLLDADARMEGVLESGSQLIAEVMADEEQPRTFGVWRVLGPLGSGGMGEVWLAERDDAGFIQRAAIKRVAWPTPGLLQRFQRERQILAQLEHPGIARLIDGGVDDSGHPYLTMEYVDGVPIDRWVREHALDPRGIVGLLAKVCEVIAFAHRNLVVHSDIKPSNILVDNDGTPRLLDFGIARVLSVQDGNATQTAMCLMTPDYAAPEWLSGGAVTTAVDVYALGVLAFELLSGDRPYRLARGEDIARRLMEHPTEPPSAAIAADRPGGHGRRRVVRGDLDRVVMTAMARDPVRRYATVEAFADDLRNWLDGRAVVARGDGALYRLRKFVGRNRVAVTATGCALLALVGATAYSLHAADVARAQAARAETVSGFLIDMFRVADPRGTPGGFHLSALQMLDAGARRYDRKLAEQPVLAAKLATTLATIYSELGQYQRAIALAGEALRQPGIDADARANGYAVMARAQYEKGDYTGAQASIDAARELDTQEHGRESVRVAADIALSGEIARRQGDFTRAESLTLHALALSQKTLESPDAQIAAELNQLAVLYGNMRRVEEARKPTEQALAMFRELYGDDHLDVAENTVNLGVIDMQTGKIDDALLLFRKAEAIYGKLLPADHPLLANTLTNHARALDRAGRYREAQARYVDALAMQRKLLGEKHPDVATTLNNMAVLEFELGDFRDAAAHFREVLDIWAAQGKPDHPLAQISRIHLASALREDGEFEQSVASLMASRDLARKTFGDAHPVTMLAGVQLGVSLRTAGKPDRALRVEQEVSDVLHSSASMPALFRVKAEVQYALSELAAGDKEAARRRIDAASEAFSKMEPVDPISRGLLLTSQARILFAEGERRAGCGFARQAMELARKTFGAESVHTARARAVGAVCDGR